MGHLSNAVTIVTGASSGIGAATAKRLAAAGARVVLAARNEDKLRDLVAAIKDEGGKAAYKVTDVTDPADLKALAAFAEETYGPVDILVNNAGLMLFSSWKDTALDDWSKMIDTNLHGYLYAIAAVLPSMLERKAGRILNMSLVAGIHVGEGAGVYGATKVAQEGYEAMKAGKDRVVAGKPGSKFIGRVLNNILPDTAKAAAHSGGAEPGSGLS